VPALPLTSFTEAQGDKEYHVLLSRLPLPRLQV